MRTSTSPAFTGWLSSTSTASTLPGILGAIAVMCASTCASSLDTRSRKWKYAQIPANTASSSMPRKMNLTGERRGSSSAGSATSGLGDFDNSSITSGILIITFPHLDVASRVPDPSGCPTRSSGSTFRHPPAAATTRPCRYFGTEPRGQTERFRVFLAFSAQKTAKRSVCPRVFGDSFHHHRPPYRRGLADQEHQRDDHEEQTSHHPERVGEGQHAGLLQQRPVNQSLRPSRRVGGRGTARLKRHRRLPQCLTIGRIVGREVRHQHRLVELGASRQHGGGGGDPRTAADVACQIEEAGGVVHALARNPRESHRAD